MSKKFPKSARILTSSHYQFLRKHSERLFGKQIIMDIRQGNSKDPRLGLTVSKKFGKAHERNRFKRIVREAFREIYSTLPSDLEMNVSPRTKYSADLLSTHIILSEMKNLIANLQIRASLLK